MRFCRTQISLRTLDSGHVAPQIKEGCTGPRRKITVFSSLFINQPTTTDFSRGFLRARGCNCLWQQQRGAPVCLLFQWLLVSSGDDCSRWRRGLAVRSIDSDVAELVDAAVLQGHAGCHLALLRRNGSGHLQGMAQSSTKTLPHHRHRLPTQEVKRSNQGSLGGRPVAPPEVLTRDAHRRPHLHPSLFIAPAAPSRP